MQQNHPSLQVGHWRAHTHARHGPPVDVRPGACTHVSTRERIPARRRRIGRRTRDYSRIYYAYGRYRFTNGRVSTARRPLAARLSASRPPLSPDRRPCRSSARRSDRPPVPPVCVPARRTSLETAFPQAPARCAPNDWATVRGKKQNGGRVAPPRNYRPWPPAVKTAVDLRTRVNEHEEIPFETVRTPSRFVWTKVKRHAAVSTRRRASTGDRTFFRFSAAVARAGLVRENG